MLSRAGRLDLLRLVGDRIIVPIPVVEEVAAHSDEAAQALAEHGWLEQRPAVQVSTEIAAWDLGSGESAVVSWSAAHPGSVAILDDFAARTCAQGLGIPVVGTLGLALRAKVSGQVGFGAPTGRRAQEGGTLSL